MSKEDNSLGKFISSVKVGPKGQIVIPKEVRKMFEIETGDTLVLLADSEQGIAVQKYDVYSEFFEQVFKFKNTPTETK